MYQSAPGNFHTNIRKEGCHDIVVYVFDFTFYTENWMHFQEEHLRSSRQSILTLTVFSY